MGPLAEFQQLIEDRDSQARDTGGIHCCGDQLNNLSIDITIRQHTTSPDVVIDVAGVSGLATLRSNLALLWRSRAEAEFHAMSPTAHHETFQLKLHQATG